MTVRQPNETAPVAVRRPRAGSLADPAGRPPLRPDHHGAAQLSAADTTTETPADRPVAHPAAVAGPPVRLQGEGRAARLAFLAPSLVVFVGLLLPAVPAVLLRHPPAVARSGNRPRPRGWGPAVRRRAHRHRSSSTAWLTPGSSCSTPCRSAWCSASLLAGGRPPPPQGHQGLPDDLLLDGRHVGRGRVGGLLHAVQPRGRLLQERPWLSLTDGTSALFAVALSSVWQNLGLTFVIVLAGLQAVPDELIEAATLDGYGARAAVLPDHRAAHLARR